MIYLTFFLSLFLHFNLAQGSLGQVYPQKAQSSPQPCFDLIERVEGPVTIREYVKNNGKVFAISWKGASMRSAKLDIWLGAYAKGYQTALSKEPRRRKRTLMLEVNNLNVVRSKTRKMHRGKAWDSSEVPTCMAPEDIQYPL